MSKLITIKTDGSVTETDITAPPSLETLQEIVGGYIEAVPYFNSYGGEPCVAFCNEEGKLDGLPVNEVATAAWGEVLAKHGGLFDLLVGDIVIVTGDAARRI